MSLRRSTPAVVAVSLAMLVLPAAAVAAPSARTAARSVSPAASALTVRSTARSTRSPLTGIPITGTAAHHKQFTGHFTVHRFVLSHGTEYAVGVLTGHIGHRAVTRSGVAIPVTVPTSSTKTAAAPAAAACSILHLDLGPLNLNLLGLHVHLNQVVLDITATPGSGQLLGNLLCDVANLLNNGGLTTTQVNTLLNILQQVLGDLSVLNL